MTSPLQMNTKNSATTTVPTALMTATSTENVTTAAPTTPINATFIEVKPLRKTETNATTISPTTPMTDAPKTKSATQTSSTSSLWISAYIYMIVLFLSIFIY